MLMLMMMMTMMVMTKSAPTLPRQVRVKPAVTVQSLLSLVGWGVEEDKFEKGNFYVWRTV